MERLLSTLSLVPTRVRLHFSCLTIKANRHFQNAFAEKLGDLGLNPYVMLVVDLMHEFELGVWKAIFTHLIRILYAAAPHGSLVAELNRR